VPIRVMHRLMLRCAVGRLANISLGGALILSPLESNVGARVQVYIPMSSDGATNDSVIDAYLVRRSETAIAIEWAEFAPTEVIDLVRARPSHPSAMAHYASASA
jgi:PilZ domain